MNADLTRSMYRAFLRAARAANAPLRIRLPVWRSESQWMRGTQQFGFIPNRSACKDIFPSLEGTAGDVVEALELSEADFRAALRKEFRRTLREPPAGDVVDQGLTALRALHEQLEMARRSSYVRTDHASGAAVTVEATSLLLGMEPGPSGAFVFQYRLRIANVGSTPVQLIGRQWTIRNSDGTVHASVTRGSPGVVGQTPRLMPDGDAFEYASGTSLDTPGGSVEGSFQMAALLADGQQESFDAFVGRFECIVDACEAA